MTQIFTYAKNILTASDGNSISLVAALLVIVLPLASAIAAYIVRENRKLNKRLCK